MLQSVNYLRTLQKAQNPTVIDFDMDKWKKRLNDKTISLDEVRNTYKMFHSKDLGTKDLDYNIGLAFKNMWGKSKASLVLY